MQPQVEAADRVEVGVLQKGHTREQLEDEQQEGVETPEGTQRSQPAALLQKRLGG